MLIDWKNYKQELGKRVGEIGSISPDTVAGYKMARPATPPATWIARPGN